MHQDWYTYSIYNATIQVQSSLSMRRPTMRSNAISTAWNSDFSLLVIQPYYKTIHQHNNWTGKAYLDLLDLLQGYILTKF